MHKISLKPHIKAVQNKKQNLGKQKHDLISNRNLLKYIIVIS